MKKKLFLAAAVLSLTACSNEEVASVENSSVSTTSQGTKLSFNFVLPSTTPVTYTTTHTEAESKVEKLDIYQFKLVGSSLDDNATLEHIYGNVTATPVFGKTDEYTADISVKQKGQKRFVLVANNIDGTPGYFGSAVSSPLNTTYGQFKTKVSEVLNNKHLNGNPLVMTDFEDINMDDSNPSARVDLMRVMARLDIRNEDNNFLLKSVQLLNTQSSVYLFKKNEQEGLATTSSNLSTPTSTLISTLPEVDLPETEAPNAPIGFKTEGAVKIYNHVFYPYPSNTGIDMNNAPTIVLKGELTYGNPSTKKNVTYYYKLKKNNTEFFAFKRNTLYTVVIKKAISEEQLDATININDWVYESSEHQINHQLKTIPTQYSDYEDNGVVTNVISGICQNPSLAPGETHAEVDCWVKVKREGGEVKLYFNTSAILEVVKEIKTSDASWIDEATLTSKRKTEGDGLSAHETYQTYVIKFMVKDNPTGVERDQLLRVRYMQGKAHSYVLRIKQAGL